jgi:ABC-type transport system involved in cytochrome bd biosynthesis fused ATPase/permease subunit
MAKKSKRAKAKHRARAAKAVQERHPQQLRPMPAELRTPARVSPKAQDLTSYYQYVVPEIKRIGIIAGSIIFVLIILSFVLG